MIVIIVVWANAVVCLVLLRHLNIDLEQKRHYLNKYIEDAEVTRRKIYSSCTYYELEQAVREFKLITAAYNLWMQSRHPSTKKEMES